jgi:vacuolar-type H+-ATPase subunit E/Vma4
MRLIPFVAIASGIALIVTGVMNIGNEADKSTNLVVGLDGAIQNAGNSAERSVGQFEATANGIKRINDEIARGSFTAAQTSAAYDRAETIRFKNMAAASKVAADKAGPKMPDFSSLLRDMASGGKGSASALNDELDKLAREAEKAAKEAADAMAKIEAEAQAERERAAAAEQAVLDKRENAYKSFTDSVKSLFGQIKDSILSSFNLPTLGNSVNSITRNIGKLLEKTKGFANDIAQLSGLGLNSALLQQVIQAGPVAGSRLASAIVGGGSAFISQLNSAYGEMGNLASGIAGVGTGSAFANQAVVNNYNIEVNGGVGSGPTIGKAIVDAIKSYERTSGAVWQGA